MDIILIHICIMRMRTTIFSLYLSPSLRRPSAKRERENMKRSEREKSVIYNIYSVIYMERNYTIIVYSYKGLTLNLSRNHGFILTQKMPNAAKEVFTSKICVE